MAGYVATERIARARPRFVGTGVGWAVREPIGGATDRHHPRSPADDRPLDRRIQDALSELREEWSQATFFLFDPNSWR